MVLAQRTTDDLRRHAAELAAAHEVILEYVAEMASKEGHAVQFGPFKVVYHKPIENEADYAGVLHEIGHCASNLGGYYGDSRRPPLTLAAKLEALDHMLTRERAAWEWAQYYAEQFTRWSVAMEQVRTICLGDYEAKTAEAKRNLVDARDAAIEDRNRRGSEPIGAFVGRAAAGVPAPEKPRPRFSCRETIADFLGRIK
jgi:hypothetical protein